MISGHRGASLKLRPRCPSILRALTGSISTVSASERATVVTPILPRKAATRLDSLAAPMLVFVEWFVAFEIFSQALPSRPAVAPIRTQRRPTARQVYQRTAEPQCRRTSICIAKRGRPPPTTAELWRWPMASSHRSSVIVVKMAMPGENDRWAFALSPRWGPALQRLSIDLRLPHPDPERSLGGVEFFGDHTKRSLPCLSQFDRIGLERRIELTTRTAFFLLGHRTTSWRDRVFRSVHGSGGCSGRRPRLNDFPVLSS